MGGNTSIPTHRMRETTSRGPGKLLFNLTTERGNAIVVKSTSHILRNKYLRLLQGIMSVKKQRKKYIN